MRGYVYQHPYLTLITDQIIARTLENAKQGRDLQDGANPLALLKELGVPYDPNRNQITDDALLKRIPTVKDDIEHNHDQK